MSKVAPLKPVVPQLVISPPDDEGNAPDDEAEFAKRVRRGRRHSDAALQSLDTKDEDPDDDDDEEEVKKKKVTAEPKEPSIVFPHQYYHTPGRKKWFNRKDFLLLIVGICVGVSNVSEFPIDTLNNGGSAYFIPYIIMLLTYALPVIYLEIIIGQYVQRGVLGMWKLCPMFKGIGIAILFMTSLFPFFYTVQITWFMSFMWRMAESNPIDWMTCGRAWNTPNCITVADYIQKKVQPSTLGNATPIPMENLTGRLLATEEYYRLNVLGEVLEKGRTVHGLYSMGHVNFELAIFAGLIYIYSLLALGFGHRVNGKLAWLTVILPAFAIAIITFRGISLPGSYGGIDFLLIPKVAELRKLRTWKVASFQSVYSTGAGTGLHMTFASYNDFDRPLLRYALMAVLVDFAFSILSTLLAFSYLGNVTFNLQTKVEYLTDTSAAGGLGKDGLGRSLVFEIFPGIVAAIPGAKFFGFLFYFMVMEIGIDNVTACFEVFLTAFMDEYPEFFNKFRFGRIVFLFTILVVSLVVNLACASPGGVQFYLILQQGLGGLCIPIAGMLFVIVISGFVGTQEIRNAIAAMDGHVTFFPFFQLCWTILTPGFISVVVVVGIMESFAVEPDWYKNPLPATGLLFIYAITYTPFLAVPIYGLYYIFWKAKAPTLRLKCLMGITPEHEHEEVLETGTGFRATCVQCCCLSLIFKKKIAAPIANATARRRLSASEELKAVSKVTISEVDPEPDSNLNINDGGAAVTDSTYTVGTIDEPVPGEDKKNMDPEDVGRVSKFLKKGKHWKEAPMGP